MQIMHMMSKSYKSLESWRYILQFTLPIYFYEKKLFNFFCGIKYDFNQQNYHDPLLTSCKILNF